MTCRGWHVPDVGRFLCDGCHSAQAAVVPARGKALIPTDLAIALPEGTYGRIAPRSGLAWFHRYRDCFGMNMCCVFPGSRTSMLVPALSTRVTDRMVRSASLLSTSALQPGIVCVLLFNHSETDFAGIHPLWMRYGFPIPIFEQWRPATAWPNSFSSASRSRLLSKSTSSTKRMHPNFRMSSSHSRRVLCLACVAQADSDRPASRARRRPYLHCPTTRPRRHHRLRRPRQACRVHPVRRQSRPQSGPAPPTTRSRSS